MKSRKGVKKDTVRDARQWAVSSPIKSKPTENTPRKAALDDSPQTTVNPSTLSLKAQFDAIRRPKGRQPHNTQPRRSLSSTVDTPSSTTNTPRKQAGRQERTASASFIASPCAKMETKASTSSPFLQQSSKFATPKHTPPKLRLRKSTPAVRVAKSPASVHGKSKRAGAESMVTMGNK